MRIFNYKVGKLLVAVLLLAAVIIVITCSKPFEPVEPKDYPFYFVDIGSDQLFVF